MEELNLQKSILLKDNYVRVYNLTASISSQFAMRRNLSWSLRP